MEDTISVQKIINDLMKTIVELKVENSLLKREITELKNSHVPEKPKIEGLSTRRF